MNVISLVNQKGGVAKTTTAAALADYFARNGKKTLLVDFDPQGSLTTSFGLADDTDNPQALKFLSLDKGMPEAEIHKLQVCLISLHPISVLKRQTTYLPLSSEKNVICAELLKR